MKPDIKEILDICIKAIEGGEKTMEECLHAYEDRRFELEPMLIAAAKLVNTGKSLPVSTRKQEIRDRLMAEADKKRWEAGLEREAVEKAPAGIMRLRTTLARISLITAAFVLIGGTTLALAKESLPGSPLYPVKLAVENARFELARDDDTKKRLYVNAAKERLDELKRMESGSEHYQGLVLSVAEKLEMADATLDNDDYKEEFNELIKKNIDVLEAVLEKAPEKARPAILNALKNIGTDKSNGGEGKQYGKPENDSAPVEVEKELPANNIVKPDPKHKDGSAGGSKDNPGYNRMPKNIEMPESRNKAPVKPFDGNGFGSRGQARGID